MSKEKVIDSEREYRDRFFATVQDREPELGKYCVIDFGAYAYEVGIFVDTPWDGILFLTETNQAFRLTPDAEYAYIEELDV